MEDEGCGEMHCEREKQREYNLPDTYAFSSRSVFGLGFHFLGLLFSVFATAFIS